MKNLFVFVSAILLLAATAASSPVLVAMSFVVIFIGIGVSVYRIAQRTGSDNGRRNFFFVSYAVSLAAFIAGNVIVFHAGALGRLDASETEIFGAFILVIGFGLALSVTGGLIAHVVRKKRDEKKLTYTPENEQSIREPGGCINVTAEKK